MTGDVGLTFTSSEYGSPDSFQSLSGSFEVRNAPANSPPTTTEPRRRPHQRHQAIGKGLKAAINTSGLT